MIRRIRRPLYWFGAVAALLLLALPAQADDIEPEPYVEEEVEPEPEPEVEEVAEEEPEAEVADESDGRVEKAFDVVLIRPLYFARFVVGLPFFVFYPLTMMSDYDEDVVALLWTDPFEATFRRPLGVPESDY